MLFSLDIRTLSFTSGFISIVLSVSMLYVIRYRRTYDGFSKWVVSSILYAIGMLLMSFRDLLPDLFTIVFANSMIIMGNVCICAGLEIFLEGKRHPRVFLGINILIFVVLLYLTYVRPDVVARIVVISSFMVLIWGYCAYITHRYIPTYMNDKNLLLTFVFGFQSLWSVTRIVGTVVVEPELHDFMQSSGVQSASFFVFIGGSILIITGLIILNLQRVEFDLATANEEIVNLQGIIPICSVCKKIRNDDGVWDQLERYIQSHTEAEFSHSICPECMRQKYPDFSEDQDEDGEMQGLRTHRSMS